MPIKKSTFIMNKMGSKICWPKLMLPLFSKKSQIWLPFFNMEDVSYMKKDARFWIFNPKLLTLSDRAPFHTLSDRGGGGGFLAPRLSRKLL